LQPNLRTGFAGGNENSANKQLDSVNGRMEALHRAKLLAQCDAY